MSSSSFGLHPSGHSRLHHASKRVLFNPPPETSPDPLLPIKKLILEGRDFQKKLNAPAALDKYIAAIKAFEDTYTAFPNDVKMREFLAKLYIMVGNCYFKQSRVDLAHQNFENAQRLDPNDTRLEPLKFKI